MRKILVVLLIPMLVSCNSDYVVNAVHSPQFESKGQVRFGLSLKTVEFSEVPTVEPESAWAITKHIGIIANGSFGMGSEAG